MMTIPSIGEKRGRYNVYSITSCEACKEKVKRPFEAGDYVYKTDLTCSKCGGKAMVVQIYAEAARLAQQAKAASGSARAPTSQ